MGAPRIRGHHVDAELGGAAGGRRAPHRGDERVGEIFDLAPGLRAVAQHDRALERAPGLDARREERGRSRAICDRGCRFGRTRACAAFAAELERLREPRAEVEHGRTSPHSGPPSSVSSGLYAGSAAPAAFACAAWASSSAACTRGRCAARASASFKVIVFALAVAATRHSHAPTAAERAVMVIMRSSRAPSARVFGRAGANAQPIGGRSGGAAESWPSSSGTTMPGTAAVGVAGAGVKTGNAGRAGVLTWVAQVHVGQPGGQQSLPPSWHAASQGAAHAIVPVANASSARMQTTRTGGEYTRRCPRRAGARNEAGAHASERPVTLRRRVHVARASRGCSTGRGHDRARGRPRATRPAGATGIITTMPPCPIDGMVHSRPEWR